MKAALKFFHPLGNCSSGTSLVKMAIVVPLAISFMAGGVDFGLALSAQATLSKSVRNAARFMASLPTSNIDPVTGNPMKAYCSDWAIAKTHNLVVYGNVSATGNTLISDWMTNGGGGSIKCATPLTTLEAQHTQT